MNSFKLKENKSLKEKYYFTQLDNGFKITVIPKDIPTKFAFVCCDFGAADIQYEHNGETKSFPAGIAHFLEHKMFENADGSDAFLEFDSFGGNANAFTGFENTCYYFSCTENFFENLEILLSAVSGAHFTRESIEKERKIIAREIVMYEDQPFSVMMQNLNNGMYVSHPITKSIAGSIESIGEITKETLLEAFERFYVPENLSLCVCGDIDKDRVLETAKRYFSKNQGKRPKTVFPLEPVSIGSPKATGTAMVASPLYAIGIKCKPDSKNDIQAFRKATAMRIAISLAFGRASDFYCNNYKKGLLNERFYAGYTASRGTAHIIISGSGNEYEHILSLVKQELEYRKIYFFTEEQFLREKKAAYAECLTLFDSGEDLTAAMASNAFLNYDEFDCIEVLRDISYNEVKEVLCSVDTENSTLSIIQKGN